MGMSNGYILAAVDHGHLSLKPNNGISTSLPSSLHAWSDVRVMSISILETGRKAPASMVIHWFDAPSALQKVYGLWSATRDSAAHVMQRNWWG